MQILSIHLKNIKSHSDRELHFVSGINVLSGDNGVGKSTIFEAIGYALFGVDARDFVGNIERFISIGAKKGEIAVTFAPGGGETYKVSRTVGAGSKWLLARELGGAFEVEDHAGAPETEARIKELLGLDNGRALAEQFKLVIGPFQHEFLGPFVLKQPIKRQTAFDEILGIDAWRKTYKGTSTLLTSVQNKIKLLNAEIEGKEEQIVTLSERRKELKELGLQEQARQKELGKKEKSLAVSEKEISQLDAWQKTAQTLQEDIKDLNTRIALGQEKIAEQRKRVAEAEEAGKTLEKTKADMEAFVAAESQLKALREQEKERQKIKEEIIDLDQENAKLSHSLSHERQEVAKAEKELAAEEVQLAGAKKALIADESITKTADRLPTLRKEQEEILAGQGLLAGRRAGLEEGREKLAEGACPFFKEPCLNIADKAPRDVFSAKVEELDKEGRLLESRLTAVTQEIKSAEKAQRQLEAIRVRGQEIDKQLKILVGRRAENKRRREKLVDIEKLQLEAGKKAQARKEDLKKFGHLDKEISKAEERKSTFQAARDTYFANQKDAQDLKGRCESLANMEQLLGQLQKNLVGKQEELAAIDKLYDGKRHDEAKEIIKRLVGEVGILKTEIKGFGKDIQRVTVEIKKMEAIKKEIKARSAEKKGYADKEELVKFLRNKIFNNVSVKLSERFREEISLRADRIYRTIAESDEELHWGDKYRIILRDMEDGELRERSDDQLSGGQIMSAVVALRLALLQTIGARVAFFDEPTSNLDAARRANLAQAFRAIDVGREEVTEHWYDQLFLISHDVAFTEVTDQIISLE